MTSRLVIDRAKLAELLTGPTGPVYLAVRHMADEIVADVKANGPIGFDQGGSRATGLLRDDMRVRGETISADRVTITVGTDPENPKDGYHYAAAVHTGRAAIDSASIMKFVDRGGVLRYTHHVGPARSDPFLYDAVKRINDTSVLKFELLETPTLF